MRTYERIKVEALTARIGAEVSGVDLSDPLGNQTFEEIHDALMDYLVLFFRDQPITLEEQIAFGRRFGELHTHPAAPHAEGHPEVMIVHADAKSSYVNGGGWHTDVSCEAEPPMGSILRLHTLPSRGGDTIFASMYAAYEALSDKMQRFLSGLTALHSGEHVYRGRYKENGIDDRGKVFPEAEHPVIRTHPVTRRPLLYVNRGFTRHIAGMKRAESDALLGFLYRHIEDPAFQVRFRWSENAIAFWDNRPTQHLAIWDYYPETRSGYRVTIKGDRPFYAG